MVLVDYIVIFLHVAILLAEYCKISDVRMALQIKYIYPPKNDNKIGPKCKISSECSLSQNNKKHYNNIFS